MRTIALIIVCAALAALPAAQKGKTPAVRVYVFTAGSPSGTAPDDQQDRENAVKELRSALAKKKGLTLVDDRGDADVRLEVVKCEAVSLGGGGFGGKMVTPLDKKIIHVHGVAPSDQTDLRGEALGYWSKAAKDAADRIAKWIARQPNAKDRERVQGSPRADAPRIVTR